MKESTKGHLPIEALLGWIPRVEMENDAVEFAKGQIDKHFSAREISWYAVAPFDTGYLYEIHHGGSGRGYLKSVIENLRADPDGEYWFPSGNRAFKIVMQEGEPLAVLLPEADSKRLVLSGHPALLATLNMKPAVAKGQAIFNFGLAMASTAVVCFLGSLIFYAVAANPGPSVRAVDFSLLPHAQWSLASNVTVEEIVSKVEMKNGKWTVDKRRNIIEGIDDLRSKGRNLDAKNRQQVVTPQANPGAPITTTPVEPASAVFAPNNSGAAVQQPAVPNPTAANPAAPSTTAVAPTSPPATVEKKQ